MKSDRIKQLISLIAALVVAGNTMVWAAPSDPGNDPAQLSPPTASEPQIPEDSTPLESTPTEDPVSSSPNEENNSVSSSESEDTSEDSETSSQTDEDTSESSQTSSLSMDSSSLPAEFGNDLWNEDLAVTLSLACDWVNSEQGSLYFLCMGTAGKSAVSKNLNQYITDVSLKKDYDDIIELSYDILNVTFSGYNARNVLGKDLIDRLAAYPEYDSKDLYSVAYALLAIDSNPYEVQEVMKNSRANLKNLLLSFQNQDGGFYSYQSGQSSVIQTGLALTALAPYREEENIKQAIDNGISFLSAQQLSDGFFLDDTGKKSCVAVCKVITALNTLGLSVKDSRFIKMEKT